MSGHPGWEAVIGLEIHVQLATRAKIFSGAANRFGAPPNSLACPVDLGLPGVLPVLNEAPVYMAVKFGLAVGAEICPRSSFDRKNYFYPDLPKGYQISQFERPVVGAGRLEVRLDDGNSIEVGIVRAHLEEDAGKSIHDAYEGETGVDLNRAGTPLLEVVSAPDMHAPEQASAFFRQMHSLVRYLGICDGDLSQGSMRCDVNVSVRPAGEEKLGERAEVKNLNSFRFVEKALRYEIDRQVELRERGLPVVRETRLYDSVRDETRPMRGKERSDDYRYFPDPDLPPLAIDDAFIAAIRAELPELPWERRARFLKMTVGSSMGFDDGVRITERNEGEADKTVSVGGDDGVDRNKTFVEYDADRLTRDPDIADYFEAVLAAVRSAEPTTGDQEGREAISRQAKLAANWILGELARHLNQEGLGFTECRLPAAALGALITRIEDETISGKTAKTLFDALWEKAVADAGGELAASSLQDALQLVDELIETHGLRQVSDRGELQALVAEVVAAHPQQAEQFRAGRTKVLGFFVGQVMKATGGKANPQQVNALLQEALHAPS